VVHFGLSVRQAYKSLGCSGCCPGQGPYKNEDADRPPLAGFEPSADLWMGWFSRFSDSSICCRRLLRAVIRSRRRFFSFSVLRIVAHASEGGHAGPRMVG